MKKTRIFNLHIYLNALKRTSVLAACCVGLICLIYAQNDRPNILDSYINSEMYFKEPDELILITILIFVPLFVFVAFSFLRNRAATDFVNSLPDSRVSTMTSCFSAAITWPVLIYLLYYTFILVLLVCCGKTPDFTGFAAPAFGFFSALILLSALSFFAVSVTGTLLTGICVFICSALLPIFSVYCFVDVVSYTPIPRFISLDTNQLNLENLTSTKLILIVGIILIVISAFLYIRRKSELSGSTALTKRSHVILSVFLTCPLMCVFSTFIPSLLLRKDFPANQVHTTVFTYAVILVIALLVWFVFNLAVKKSLSGALVSLRWSPLILAIPVLLSSYIAIFSASVLSFSPESNEVKSVSVKINGSCDRACVYFHKKLDGMTFTDEEEIKIFCDTLKLKIAYASEDWFFSPDAGDYESEIFAEYADINPSASGCLTVEYTLKNGKTVSRIKCPITPAFASLSSMEKYSDAFLYIDPETVTGGYVDSDYAFDPENSIFRLFIEEFNEAPVKERLNAIYGYWDQTVFVEFPDREFLLTIPVSFKKTHAMIYEQGVKQGKLSSTEDAVAALETIKDFEFNGQSDGTFSAVLCYDGAAYVLPEIGYYYNIDTIPYSKKCISHILSDPLIHNSVDTDGTYVIVHYSTSRDDESSGRAYLNLSKETALSIIAEIDAFAKVKNPNYILPY